MTTLTAIQPLASLVSPSSRIARRGSALRVYCQSMKRFTPESKLMFALESLVASGATVRVYHGNQIATLLGSGVWESRSTSKVRATTVVEVSL